jgi:hypothetical protein
MRSVFSRPIALKMREFRDKNATHNEKACIMSRRWIVVSPQADRECLISTSISPSAKHGVNHCIQDLQPIRCPHTSDKCADDFFKESLCRPVIISEPRHHRALALMPTQRDMMRRCRPCCLLPLAFPAVPSAVDGERPGAVPHARSVVAAETYPD